MKSKKIFLLFAAFIFAAAAIYNIHLAQTQNIGDISLADISIMAQAQGESGDVIQCKCNWWNNCKASGSGNLCAQSEPGGLIECWRYNKNC